MFTYVTDTSTWEPWQQEYRYGLILIMPPPDVMAIMDSLRCKFDPRSAAICQGHVSLSEPLPRPLTPELLDEVRAILAKVEPFEITYGPLRTFPPYPGVTYRIEPEDRFFALREALHGASVFEGSPFKRKDRAPHMTIAEFLPDIEASERLREELQGNVPEGTFLCDRLEYIVPDEGFRLQRVLELWLDAAHGR
jgi:hypothetical protein